MELKSLYLRHELAFLGLSGEICDRGEYIAVKSPENPGYHWGNFIVFNAAPKPGDCRKWCEIFRKEFTFYSEIRHMSFTWDCPGNEQGETGEFSDSGFELDKTEVLAAERLVMPRKYNREVTIQTIHEERVFEELVTLLARATVEEYEPENWEKFTREQTARDRKIFDAGWGNWHGAFLNGKLVGALAYFQSGRLGQCQHVSVHPDFRRRGICGRLVFEVANEVLASGKAEKILIDADPNYHAIRIYEDLGFGRIEVNHGLGWCADEVKQWLYTKTS